MKYTHEDGTPFSKEEFLEKLRTDKEFNDEFSIRWILQGRGRSQKHKEKYKNWFYIN
jgi:hypothetical protein